MTLVIQSAGTMTSGARVVYLGQGWQDISVSADLRGTSIDFTLSTSGRENTENFALNYQANHLRPLSPVHIKAVRIGDNIDISWIRRTRTGGDDWAWMYLWARKAKHMRLSFWMAAVSF